MTTFLDYAESLVARHYYAFHLDFPLIIFNYLLVQTACKMGQMSIIKINKSCFLYIPNSIRWLLL